MEKKTIAGLLTAALAAVAAVVVLCSRSAAVEAVYPAERAKAGLVRRLGQRLKGAWRGAAASAECARLKREIAALSLAREDAERLEAENVRLRKALGYVEAHPGEWLAAAVLSRGGGAAAAHRTLRVDRGSLAGVVEGSAVVVAEGLVGRVTGVTPHTSEVTLVTDPSVKVACEVECDARRPVRGILCGGGEDLLVLRHLRDSAEVPPRSRVLTSGLGGVFPRGLVVGALLQIRKDADGLACEGEVLPAVEYEAVEDVFIRRAK